MVEKVEMVATAVVEMPTVATVATEDTADGQRQL
jgi:hypothetical protein